MILTFHPIPLKTIKLVIFDLDGTLVDSKLDLATSVNAMLRHYGRQELPIQVIGTYIGDGAPMLIPYSQKVVRRTELLKGHRHGFRFQACS
jgi:phosphoglycolate phosphatase